MKKNFVYSDLLPNALFNIGSNFNEFEVDQDVQVYSFILVNTTPFDFLVFGCLERFQRFLLGSIVRNFSNDVESLVYYV